MVKKLIACVITFTMLLCISTREINATFSNFTFIEESDEEGDGHLRSLRYSSTSTSRKILYTKPYKDNNVTGTGSKLKDVAYRVSCRDLLCKTECCDGDINAMVCGTPENCKIYTDYVNLQLILGYTLGIGGGIIAFILGIASKSKKGSCGDRLCYGLTVVICIIFSPIILIFWICKKICCKNDDDV
jgi:hypothetical protein